MLSKTSLSEIVAEKTGLSKKDSAAAVAATFEAIQDALVEGEKVQLIGFGTFEVRERSARMGKNPKTGEPLEIPAQKSAALKAGKALKEAING